MNIITDKIKHKNTVNLSKGTTNGAFIWLQINESCMVMSSLAPWNAYGRVVVEEMRSIGTEQRKTEEWEMKDEVN